MTSFSSFLVLILLLGHTLLSVNSLIECKPQKTGSFWNTFDQHYGNKIDAVVDDKINSISTSRILGVTRVTKNQGVTHENINDELNSQPNYAPGIDIMGRGFNFVKGISSTPLFQWTRNHQAKYHSPYTRSVYDLPDEVFVLNTPELSGHEESGVFSSATDYQASLANQYGLNGAYDRYALGLTEDVTSLKQVLSTVNRHWGVMERVYVLNTMSLLPLQYMTVDPRVTSLLNVLPRLDVTTKNVYYNLFEQLGTHFVHTAAFGGSMALEQVFEVKTFANITEGTLLDLLSFRFDFLTVPGLTLRNESWEQSIRTYISESYNVTNFKGGDPNAKFTFAQYQEWADTLKNYPVPVRCRLVEISELVADPVLRAEISKAIASYAADLLATEASIQYGPAVNYANPDLGASVFSTSSVGHDCFTKETCARCWLLWTCCDNTTSCIPRKNQPNLISNLAEDPAAFTFNNDDLSQSVILDLGAERKVLRFETEVEPAGRLNEAWDYIEVLTSLDNFKWQHWGIKGNKDGQPDIIEAANQISHVFPTNARFIKVNYGPCSLHGGLGSKVHSIRVFGVESSKPIGHFESVSDGVVRGWAFDPLDTTQTTTIEVYINGRLYTASKTSVARPEIASKFNISSVDVPLGFEVPITLPPPRNTAHQMHIKFIGIGGGSLISNSLQKWISVPSGNLLRVTPFSVTGWALDIENLSNPVPVDIFINGVKQYSTSTAIINEEINRLYGIQGAHGFEVNLNDLKPGVHTISAKAWIKGQERSLSNSLTLDLRSPIGKIESVNEISVSGWAIDPSMPSSHAIVHVYINGQYVTEQQTSIHRQEVNQLYGSDGAHGFEIPLDIRSDMSYEIAVYVLLGNGHLALVDSHNILVDTFDNRAANSILGPIGVGFDIVFEEFRLPVVSLSYSNGVTVNFGGLLNNSAYEDIPQPDQVQINVNLGNILNDTSAIYNNTQDYINKRADDTGAKEYLYLGTFAVSQSARHMEQQFATATTVVAAYDRSISLFNVLLLPPALLAYEVTARALINALPAYTNDTVAQYRDVIAQLGTHYLSRMTLGGKISSLTRVDTSKMHSSSDASFTQQVQIAFNYHVSAAGSIAKARSETNLSQEFLVASKTTFRFIGGHPELFRLEESNSWAETVVDNPVVIDYQLELISSILTDRVKRDDLERAIVDYIASNGSTL